MTPTGIYDRGTDNLNPERAKDIARRIDSGDKVVAVCKEYGIGRTHLRNLLKVGREQLTRESSGAKE